MRSLHGRIAIVTGASKGIGAATAKALALEGAKVVVNYLHGVDDADAVVGEIESQGGVAVAAQADVSRPDDIPNMFDVARRAFGDPTILVNNAGPLEFAYLDSMTPRHIDETIDRNFKSVALCTQAAVKGFPSSGGTIINVTSETVRNIVPGSAVFAAAKSAVEVLTKYLAHELGPRGIRVVGIAPGYTLTPATSGLPQSMIDHMISRTALGRAGTATDIASVVAFLASDAGAWITGTTLTVSGGLNL